MAGKRGRPRKNPQPDPEIIEAIKTVKVEDNLPPKKSSSYIYNIKIGEVIPYFDPTLSYEISGYRPIDEERGLDFKPEWFTEARRIKLETGKYCAYPAGTKKYNDYWQEQFDRCNNGYISHGYRLTGDHYFFLNFYRLKDTSNSMAGQGRQTGFPQFFSKQYEYFHYIDICERVKKDVGALKARGVKLAPFYSNIKLKIPKYSVNTNIIK